MKRMHFWGLRKGEEGVGNRIQVLYGTKSGNAKLIAKQVTQYFKKNNLGVDCHNMAGFKPQSLLDVNYLLVIVSTHGEGEPPSSALPFFEALFHQNMPSLSHLNYAICALGDSGYSMFCEAGKKLDIRLKALDAKSVLPRVDCDVSFSDLAIDWIKSSSSVISGLLGTKSHVEDGHDVVMSEKQVHVGNVRVSRSLSSMELEATSYHIEIEWQEDEIAYQPGDSIEIVPVNPICLVDKIVEKTGFKQWRQALLYKVEICRLSLHTLNKYAVIVQLKQLDELLSDPERLKEYLSKANLLDLLNDFPGYVDVNQWLNLLPNIGYRQYSIASSPLLYKKNLHLLVKPIQFYYNGLLHSGAASEYITNGLNIGDEVRFRLFKSSDFHLPQTAYVPIVMIAVGTGIAPFRAFLQHRCIQAQKGNAWLIWGNKYESSDCLYKSEIDGFLQNETLEIADLVYSQSHPSKKYVQDTLVEKGQQVLDWINRGAHFYICGSKKMGDGVCIALNALFQSKSFSGFQSIHELKNMGRYHEDLY